jgi:hypothetical protein
MITQFVVVSRFGLVLWRLNKKKSVEEDEVNSSIDTFITEVLMEERDVEDDTRKRRYVHGEVFYQSFLKLSFSYYHHHHSTTTTTTTTIYGLCI